MTRALIKNTIREIWDTKARFFSIMAIIALGVGFFSGIKATSPSMYRLAEDYYNETNLMDFRLVSTTGFSEDDIKAVSDVSGVESVMPSYFCDVMTRAEDGGEVLRLIAAPKAYGKNRELNTIAVKEGRPVKNTGEAVTELNGFADKRRKVGGKLRLAPEAGDVKLSDLLKRSEFTITGKT